MRWFVYFIVAYVMLGLQAGVAPLLRVGGAPPNLVLLTALFIALNAPRDAALLGCFGLGLMHDLLTQQAMGLYAFSYGLLAVFVTGSSQLLRRDHSVTHVMLALLGSGIGAVVILAHGWVHPPGPAVHVEGMPAVGAIRVSAGMLMYQVLYTTILSPFVLALLVKVRKLFAFQQPRRRLV
jgi:rod shape-determining protein MreD